jgi:LmbE family N-acetylglucosaminyl deacetylase
MIKDYFITLGKSVSPDLILTHRGNDAHQDHRVISELTWHTFRNHWILEYEIPKYEGDLGHPNVFVPLTAQTAREKAQKVFDGFPSQQDKPWFTTDTFLAMARIRGLECNAPEHFAEGFTSRKLAL